MSDTRKRLIELIKNAPTTDVVYGNCKLNHPAQTVQTIADHLIANGVTDQVVHCGECKHYCQPGRCTNYHGLYGRPKKDDFCSFGERKENNE